MNTNLNMDISLNVNKHLHMNFLIPGGIPTDPTITCILLRSHPRRTFTSVLSIERRRSTSRTPRQGCGNTRSHAFITPWNDGRTLIVTFGVTSPIYGTRRFLTNPWINCIHYNIMCNRNNCMTVSTKSVHEWKFDSSECKIFDVILI